MSVIRTLLGGRGKRFHALMANAVGVCGDVFSSSSTRLAKQNSTIAAKIGVRVLPNKEGFFLRAFDDELECLVVELPRVFEASLVSVFKPLMNEEKDQVYTRLDEYFRIFGERYIQNREIRLARKGSTATPVIPAQDSERPNLLVEKSKVAARRNMHRGIVARLDRYQYERRIFWGSVITGFIVGTAGSLVAQVIWVACIQGR